MSDETTQPELTDEEATQRIANMFEVLDKIYMLHAPNQTEEIWTCDACGGVQWPCVTEAIILEGLGVA